MQVRQALLAALGCWACTAVESRAAAPERHVLSADGGSIAWEEHGSGTPTLVFVHGWCGDRALWRTTLDALGREHRVVALDLAGHGASEARREAWTLESLAGDVVAVVQATGSDDVILVGHSLGAPVALLAAPRLAPRVRGVIGVEALHDPRFRYPPGYLEEAERALASDFPRAVEASLAAAAGPELADETRAWLRRRALRTDPAAARGCLAALVDFDLAEALRAARVPVRVVNAAPRTGSELVTALEAGRALADFDASVLERSGHFPMLTQPAAFQAALRHWIAELSARPRPR